jgi:hypothetical protein
MNVCTSPASLSLRNLLISVLLHAWLAALAIRLVWQYWESPVVIEPHRSLVPPGGHGDATSRQAKQSVRESVPRVASLAGVDSLTSHAAASSGSALADIQPGYLADMPGRIAIAPEMISTGLSLFHGSGRLGSGTGSCCPVRTTALHVEATVPLSAADIPGKLAELRRQLQRLDPLARFTLTCHGRTLRRFTTDALAATSDNQAAALRFAETFLTDELTSPANNVRVE